jgi:hypothetical protein
MFDQEFRSEAKMEFVSTADQADLRKMSKP